MGFLADDKPRRQDNFDHRGCGNLRRPKTGTPLASLPKTTFKAVVKQIESLGFPTINASSAAPMVHCALGKASGYVNLGFKDPNTGAEIVIDVPFSELALPGGGGDLCMFGIFSAVGGVIFGDTFMRSM